MFVFNDIEVLADDLDEIPQELQHLLTFKVRFTIKDVLDSFTGCVCEDALGNLSLQHFNHPKGNRRKIITLKNKLPAGVFDGVKKLLFAKAQGKEVNLPQGLEALQLLAKQ